jgi:hypothetical protein
MATPPAQDWRMRLRGPNGKSLISPRVTVHTVPYGTDLFRAVSLAVNCQATITRSLRGRNLPSPVHKIDFASISPICLIGPIHSTRRVFRHS